MARKKIEKGESPHIPDDAGFIENDFKKDDNEKEEKIEEVNDKKERINILKKFTKELLKKYGPIVRSVVLFGSTAREEWKGKSDIDVFVIIDDTRQKITPMAKDKIDAEMVKISKDIHSQLSVQQPYLLRAGEDHGNRFVALDPNIVSAKLVYGVGVFGR